MNQKSQTVIEEVAGPPVIIKVPVNVSRQIIVDQLESAVNGGCNYWMFQLFPVFGPLFNIDMFPGEKFFEIIFAEECGFDITHVNRGQGQEPQASRLTFDKIEKGLKIMAKKDFVRFCQIVNQTGDSLTADVFMQYCLFGELIFG